MRICFTKDNGIRASEKILVNDKIYIVDFVEIHDGGFVVNIITEKKYSQKRKNSDDGWEVDERILAPEYLR